MDSSQVEQLNQLKHSIEILLSMRHKKEIDMDYVQEKLDSMEASFSDLDDHVSVG